MLATVIIVVATHDLSKGVIAGVILSTIFFVAKIAKIKVTEKVIDSNIHFVIEGQLFFASAEDFVDAFDFTVIEKTIVINFSESHIWDDSAVGAIDKVIMKYRENNNTVMIDGLDSTSKKLVEKLTIYHHVT